MIPIIILSTLLSIAVIIIAALLVQIEGMKKTIFIQHDMLVKFQKNLQNERIKDATCR